MDSALQLGYGTLIYSELSVMAESSSLPAAVTQIFAFPCILLLNKCISFVVENPHTYAELK